MSVLTNEVLNYATSYGYIIKSYTSDLLEKNKLLTRDLPTTSRDKLSNKPAGVYLSSFIDTLHIPLDIRGSLLTCTYMPDKIHLMSAWLKIDSDLNTIVTELNKRSDIVYLLSSVEIHMSHAKDKIKVQSADKRLKPYIHECLTKDEAIIEIYSFFLEHNFYLEKEQASCHMEVVYRALTYWIYAKIADNLYLKIPLNPVVMLKVKEYLEEINKTNNLRDINILEEYFIDIYNKLSYCGLYEKKVKSLHGYPHLHIAIFTNELVDLRELERTVLNLNIFSDVNVKSSGRNASFSRSNFSNINTENDARIIGYVIKNYKDPKVINRLNRYPIKLHNKLDIKEINLFYINLSSRAEVFIDNLIDIENETIITGSSLPKYKPTSIGEYKEELEKPEETNPSVITETSKKKICYKRVCEFMTKNDLYVVVTDPVKDPLYNERKSREIYHKIPESKFTFIYWGTFENVFSKIVTVENFDETFSYESDIERLFRTEGILPSIKMIYNWIEFKDFFIHLESGILTETTMNQPSFCYFPNIGVNELKEIINNNKKPELWCSILANSKYFISDKLTKEGKNLCLSIYSLLLPRFRKTKSLFLFGESNSGKSSLLDFLRRLYPSSKLATITRGSHGFALEGIVNAEICLIDECSNLKEYGITIEDIKLLTDGGSEISINRKHKPSITIIPHFRIAFATNDDSWTYKPSKLSDDPTIKELSKLCILNKEEKQEELPKERLKELSNRMEFYNFKTLLEASQILMKRMNIEEPGIIVLYLANIYHEGGLKVYLDKQKILEIIKEYDNLVNY